MTKVVPDVELDPVLHRRKQLRYQRRWKLIQAGWRTLAIIGLTGGLVWATFLIEWVIYQPSQVVIKGNQLLATSAIEAALPLSLPQSLIRLQPKIITEALKSSVSVERVTVTRQLFPPKLIVSVAEREPVAIVPGAGDRLAPVGISPRDIWLLDSYGIIMPLESYPTLQQSRLPQLTVLGILEPAATSQKNKVQLQGRTTQVANSSSEDAKTTVTVDKQKQLQWPGLYRVLEQSPVRVFEINWQDEANVILKTELGMVHAGPYSSKFAEQLKALDQIRGLPKHLNGKQVAYIDLKNPKKPLLQLNNPK